MKKTHKKLFLATTIITAISLPLVLTTFSCSNSNSNSNSVYKAYDKLQNLYFTINDQQQAIITKSDVDASGNLIIPNEVTDSSTNKKYTVVEIGAWAFANKHIETLFFNCKSLTTIGEGAFYKSCKGTGTLDLSPCTSLTSIGSDAFHNSNMSSLVLPSSIITIGHSAFDYQGGGFLDGIKYVYFNSCKKLTTIENCAFGGCSIRDLDLSPCISLTTIGYSAFCGNMLLSNLKLPPNIKSIDSDAFGATRLCNSTVYVPPGCVYLSDSFPQGTNIITGYPPQIQTNNGQQLTHQRKKFIR